MDAAYAVRGDKFLCSKNVWRTFGVKAVARFRDDILVLHHESSNMDLFIYGLRKASGYFRISEEEVGVKFCKFLEVVVSVGNNRVSFAYEAKNDLGAPLTNESGHANSVGHYPIVQLERIRALSTTYSHARRAQTLYRQRFLRFGSRLPPVEPPSTIARCAHTRWLVMGYHPSLVIPMARAIQKINHDLEALSGSSGEWFGARNRFTRIAIAWRNVLPQLGMLVRGR